MPSSPSNSSTRLLISSLLLSAVAHGDAIFDFTDGTVFDGAGVGASMSALDPAESINVTLSTVEIIGQDGSLASDGVQLHQTNIANNSNSLGINDATNPNGAASDTTNFNPGEAWVISFDVDVKLISIDFSGQNAGELMTISSTAFAADFVLDDGQLNDIHDLLATEVPAGTNITIQMDVPPTDPSLGARIAELTVAAVPAPLTGANLVWAGSDGDAWNDTDSNFTGDDTDFNTGANVEIQTPGAINIDPASIIAGALSVTAPTGTVTLQNGSLASSSLLKTGDSILNIASPITLDTGTGITSLSGGTIQVSSGSSFLTSLVSFSGDSTLQVNSGGSLTISGGGALDTGGGTINIEEPLILGNMPNSIIDVPFTKTGSAALTFNGDLGTRTTGPVDLDILAGSVTAASGTQLNLSGVNTIDGDLILDGGRLELHGSTLSGTGSIIAQSGDATIDARFQGGMVNISNPITLTSDIFLEAPTNGDSNSELHISGIISGNGNLQKIGNGLVSLTGVNTYTGNTSLASGILSLSNATLPDTSTITIGDTGVLNLTHASGDTVTSLFINGVEMSPGTYGSSSVTGVTLQNIDDTHCNGDGWLVVTSGPVVDDYALWASGITFTGDGAPTSDDDGDGLSNNEEYLFGLDPTDPSSSDPFVSPLDPTTSNFIYTRRNNTLLTADVTYSYEYSTTLEGGFTPFIPDEIENDNGNPIETVTISVTPALLQNDRLFVRVIAQ